MSNSRNRAGAHLWFDYEIPRPAQAFGDAYFGPPIGAPVGVEHYQGVLSGRAIGAPLTVELVADVNNPHDANAVAGKIDGRVAGYLRSDVASKYRAPIVLANEHGFRLFVQTMVQEREDGLMRPGWLDIPGPEALARWLALPEAERARGFDFSAGKSPATPRSQGRPL